MAKLHLLPKASTSDALYEEIEEYNAEIFRNKRLGFKIEYIAIGAATYWDPGYKVLMVDLALLPITDAVNPLLRHEGILDAERLFEINVSKYTSHQVLGPYAIERIVRGLRGIGIDGGRVH